jgi:8-oxo-dGTP diphosphatase
MTLRFPTRPVTVDCVVFDGEAVVLIKRGHEPFKDYFALPGGFVDLNESVEEACKRELLEETGLVAKNLKMISVYSEPSRDRYRHTVSVTFLAEADLSSLKAGDDAASVELVKDWRSASLAFDHKQIIEDAQVLNHRVRGVPGEERGQKKSRDELNALTETIIGCAIKVHRKLGAGFLESVYRAALAYEFVQAGLSFEQEKGLPVSYADIRLKVGFRCDFLVEGSVIVECKAVSEMTNVDHAQALNYLKASKSPVGLLINFNVSVLKSGIKRLINKETF